MPAPTEAPRRAPSWWPTEQQLQTLPIDPQALLRLNSERGFIQSYTGDEATDLRRAAALLRSQIELDVVQHLEQHPGATADQVLARIQASGLDITRAISVAEQLGQPVRQLVDGLVSAAQLRFVHSYTGVQARDVAHARELLRNRISDDVAQHMRQDPSGTAGDVLRRIEDSDIAHAMHLAERLGDPVREMVERLVNQARPQLDTEANHQILQRENNFIAWYTGQQASTPSQAVDLLRARVELDIIRYIEQELPSTPDAVLQGLQAVSPDTARAMDVAEQMGRPMREVIDRLVVRQAPWDDMRNRVFSKSGPSTSTQQEPVSPRSVLAEYGSASSATSSAPSSPGRVVAEGGGPLLSRSSSASSLADMGFLPHSTSWSSLDSLSAAESAEQQPQPSVPTSEDAGLAIVPYRPLELQPPSQRPQEQAPQFSVTPELAAALRESLRPRPGLLPPLADLVPVTMPPSTDVIHETSSAQQPQDGARPSAGAPVLGDAPPSMTPPLQPPRRVETRLLPPTAEPEIGPAPPPAPASPSHVVIDIHDDDDVFHDVLLNFPPRSAGTPAAVQDILSNLPGPSSAPRKLATRTSRQEYVTLVTAHARTGQATPMARFASATHDIAAGKAQPAALPSQGLVARAVAAVKKRAGVSEPAAWMKATMHGLRADALGVGDADAPANRTNALSALKRDHPVSAYWNALNGHARFGLMSEPLLTRLDTLAGTHGAEVALTVSLACLNARDVLRSNTALMGPSMFVVLGDAGLIGRLTAQEARFVDPAFRLARAVLHELARNDQFSDLARAVCPQVPEHQLPVLKRFLEASDAVAKQAPARQTQPPGDDDLEALEAGFGAKPSLAQRVMNSAREQLASGATAPRSNREAADNFFWDNNFRDDGPKSPLHELKRHIFNYFDQLAKQPNAFGPLNSLYSYGLAGADRHILADEATKLMSMVASPELDPLVERIQNKLVSVLEERQRARDINSAQFDPEIARGVALLVALQSWTRDERAAFTLDDVVHGKDHSADEGYSQAQRVAIVCLQFVNGAFLDASATRPPRLPSYASDAFDHLHEQVKEELGKLRLNLNSLAGIAAHFGVQIDEAAQAQLDSMLGTINAESLRPAEKTPAAAGEVLAQFLSRVQFGNHVKVTDIATAGFSSRGVGANVASSEVGFEDIEHSRRPIVLRPDIRAERSVEHVFRAGAATHGGEMFMGQDVKWRGSVGAGIQAGYTALGKEDTLGRLAAAMDLIPYGYDHSAYEGAMWRVDRKIVSDVADPQAPQFSQNDADVRATMSEMARMLHERAPHAQDKEQLLEEFIAQFAGRGLSVTLMKQETAAHRSEFLLGGGVSATTDTRYGGRFGLGATGAMEKGWKATVKEKDTTGSYRINNIRSGWFERKRASTDIAANFYGRYVGTPGTPLLGASASFAESGGSVRVRTPLREGKIVPEKTFSDTETPDKELFKQIVLSEHQKWIDLFAYAHRHLPPAQAQQKGREAVDAFFHKIDSIREENHVYYARERMHPDVAQQIDRLSMIEQQMPPHMAEAVAEVRAKKKALASADESWGAASLIAYQRNVVQDGRAGTVMGVRGGHVAAVEGEREIVFDTIGWANLRQREREKGPGSWEA